MEKADLLAKSKDSLIDHQDETIRPLFRNSFFFLSNAASQYFISFLIVIIHMSVFVYSQICFLMGKGTFSGIEFHIMKHVPDSVVVLSESVKKENHKRLTNTSERTHKDKKFTFNFYCRS